jgi:hypothetical protein
MHGLPWHVDPHECGFSLAGPSKCRLFRDIFSSSLDQPITEHNKNVEAQWE